MSQCVRCNKPCSANAVECNECASHSHGQYPQNTITEAPHTNTAPLLPLSPVQEQDNAHADADISMADRDTLPQRVVPNPVTPFPPTNNHVELALQKLRDAALRIALVEQKERGVRPRAHRLRASRLSPWRDISADIQRDSTPMPLTFSNGKSAPNIDLGKNLPDLWPWLADPETEENEKDNWDGRTDPLLSRHIPRSEEAARIEAEDVQRAIEDGLVSMPYRTPLQRPKAAHYLRFVFTGVALLAVIALITDSVLASFFFFRPHHPVAPVQVSPAITLSSNVAQYGEHITVYLKAFQPTTHTYLTHDFEEPLLGKDKSIISTGQNGSAQATFYIDGTWEPGFHNIEAEDTVSRYTANAVLQIAAGPSRPSHLLLNTNTIDLGADVQGANTVQPFTLHNSGNGTIVWAASSNQAWLQVTPNHGTFSDSQDVIIGGQRANLAPGDYKGTLTFSTNVGTPLYLYVTMGVRPLPKNAGAVLSITPAVLSFTAQDGGGNPTPQSLTVNNPGSQSLNWQVTNSTSSPGGQDANTPVTNISWATTDQNSGTVAPHGNTMLQVRANSTSLLPGVYTNTLIFSAANGSTAYNSPQRVVITLTVQPRCGLMLSTGSLAFTAVAGQSNPSNQALILNEATSCPGTISWHATSSAPSWLTITPASGQLKGTGSAATSVSVNTHNLTPAVYNANITIQTAQNSQTIQVQLTVQPPTQPKAPIINAAPLNVNFVTTQGQSSPPGQVVTISNTGGSPLTWRTTINLLATTWLGASPTGGTIAPGQTGQVTINVNPAKLTPGSYVGQVILTGSDANNVTAGGSPQTIAINLSVSPPCALTNPSSGSLAFSATQGGSDPMAQSEMITASGNCSWPLHWQAAATSAASWLKLSPSSGSFGASGQSASLSVAPSIAGLAPGTYTTQVAITASDAANIAAQGTPQTFTVALTVQQPCSLQVSPGSLTFSLLSGQSSQTLQVSEGGTCVPPVNWSATSNSSWLSVTGSGTDTGSGSTITVSIDTTGLQPNTYTGSIKISATGNGGSAVQISPSTISVNLTVTAPPSATVSGTVNACADSACSSAQPLANASVTLVDGSGNTVASTTADGSGKYSFQKVPDGNYTISASGSDSTAHYTGHSSISVNGDRQGVSVNTFAS